MSAAEALTTEDFLAPSPVPEAEDAVEAYLAEPASRREITEPSIIAERVRAIRQTEEQAANDREAARRDATIALAEAERVLDDASTAYAEAALSFFPALGNYEDADSVYQRAWRDARSLGVDVPVKRLPIGRAVAHKLPPVEEKV